MKSDEKLGEIIMEAQDVGETRVDIVLKPHYGSYMGGVIVGEVVHKLKEDSYNQAAKMLAAYFFGK